MNKKSFQTIALLALCAVASAQQHYKAIRISTFPNETIGLNQDGLYVLANTQSGVALTALNANSTGVFAGQDASYHSYQGNATGILNLKPQLGTFSQIWAINDSGTLVGYSENAIYSNDYQGFVVVGGVVKRIPTLGGVSSTGQAVSTNNLVAGHAMKLNRVVDAILWDGSKISDLGGLGGTYFFSNTGRTFASDAWGVNSSGQVVGSAWIRSGQQRAFLWKAGKMTNLGTLGGSASAATAINDSGLVVGVSSLPNGQSHGFIYSNKRMRDVNTLISGLSAGIYINYVSQLNNRGELLAMGNDGNSYLLEPIN